jgi:hypothetical protein
MEDNKMSLEDFKKYCYDNDYNIVSEWDFERFIPKCCKCNSTHIQIGHKNKSMGRGDITGPYTREDAGLLVKCIDCGQAMTIILKSY